MTTAPSTDPLPPIVDAAWLAVHRDEIVVADVRWYLDGRRGLEAYLAGHLPGAVWVDLDTDLSAPADPTLGRHPLPTPEAFAGALGRLGIGNDATVVAYDDAGGAHAARLVWLLRRIGQRAAILDGGLAAWTGELEDRPVQLTPVPRRAIEWPAGSIRTADDMARSIRTKGTVVLDARAADRYRGDVALPTDARAGHVPGARNAPWAGNLTEAGTFASEAELRRRYEALGVTDEAEVVVYCGSGVTACHDLLALELIGKADGSLYPGSWSAWAADGERPVATGPEPG